MAFETKDSGEREEYDSGMQRDVSEGKTLWHLTASGPMMKRWAELMTRGAVKYGEDNWLKATGEEEYLRFRSSAYRHFMEWYHGLTPEEDHAAAVIFNLDGAEYVKEKLETAERFQDAFNLAMVKIEESTSERAQFRTEYEQGRTDA